MVGSKYLCLLMFFWVHKAAQGMVLSIFLPHSYTSTSFRTQYQAELIEKVKDCITRCDEDNACFVIISGRSQGGAIATVASLELSGLNTNYEVITFAAPPSVTKDPEHCSPHMNFGATIILVRGYTPRN